jgi:hypothetical protein
MIACGRDAPERRRACSWPSRQCVLAARSCARGGTCGRLALVAGKGAGLKRQARARVWLQIVGAASQDCGGSYRSGDAGRAGETVPQASCRPCRPLLCPPPRERSGRQTALARDCKRQMALDRRRDDPNVVHEKPPCWTNVGRLYPAGADNRPHRRGTRGGNSGNPARRRRRPISPRPAPRSAARGAGEVRRGLQANPARERRAASQSRQARSAIDTQLALQTRP